MDFLDLVFFLDRDGTIRDFVNPGGLELALPPESFLGLRLQDVFPEELSRQVGGVLESVSATGEVGYLEYQMALPDGLRDYEARFLSRGLETLVICRDITPRREAERLAQRNARMVRALVDASPDLAFLLSVEGTVLAINRRAAGLFGKAPQQMVGTSYWDHATPSFAHFSRERIEQVLASGRMEVLSEVDPKGRVLEMHANPIEDGRGGIAGAAFFQRDVTERLLADRAIRESEERFRTAFRTSPDAINLNRLEDGLYVDVNDGFCALSGYAREQIIGKTSSEVAIWADPADRIRLVHGLKARGEVTNLQARFLMKDGSVRHGLMSAKMLAIEGVPHILSVTRDITDLREAEEKLRASVHEKDVLLREIHHRVKNNLQVISGLLNLQAHHIDDAAGRAIYKESQNRVVSMALIHEQLYQAADLAHVNFSHYIRTLSENLFVSYGAARDRIRLLLDAEPVTLVVDTAIPCGLIVNELVSNALKHAFPDGRQGTVSVSFRKIGPRRFSLKVSDDGVGLPVSLDLRKSSSLGLNLVTILAQMLKADFAVEGKGGTRVRLEFDEYHEAGTALY